MGYYRSRYIDTILLVVSVVAKIVAKHFALVVLISPPVSADVAV